MRVLVALESCLKFSARAQLCINSWAQELPPGYDFKVFTGQVLNVPDDYYSLCIKTKAIAAYALAHEYDWLLIVDDDVYIRTQQLVIPNAHYAGMILPRGINTGTQQPYCSGGAYWLSRKALTIIANAPLSHETYAEDRWTGAALAHHGITPHDLPDFTIEPCECGQCDAQPLSPDWTVQMQITTREKYITAQHTHYAHRTRTSRPFQTTRTDRSRD
jgi:hypothetical protein